VTQGTLGTVRRILLVLCLSGLAIAYVYQHSTGMRLTRRVMRLSRERQLLTEELDRVSVRAAQLAGFFRLDSLWRAQDRSGPDCAGLRADAPVARSPVAAKAVASQVR
jgi:hypothetical protein